MSSSGDIVIGVVGNDVPRQLVQAAGARAYRLTGTWSGPLDDAGAVLGACDAAIARVHASVVSRETPLHALVVCADAQAHVRLFYALRATGFPLPLHLLDLPAYDSDATRRFARRQLDALTAFLASVTGTPPTRESLAAAAADERALGDALARLRARRRADPPTCPGAIALDAYLAAARETPRDAIRVVEAAHARVGARRRVHVTGSAHPDAQVYRILEEDGEVVVVGEDHDTGDRAWLGVAVDADTVEGVRDGLVEAHFSRVRSSPVASSADRAHLTSASVRAAHAHAVAGFVREHDEAPLWDEADQRAALAAMGVPLVVRARIGADGAPAVARELASVVRAGVLA